MANQEKQVPDGKPRNSIPLGVRLVLFASLALNLVIAGIVAGFIWRGGPLDRPPRHVRDAVAPYTTALSQRERRDIGRKLFRNRRNGDEGREDRARTRADYAQALLILRADRFDKAAFGALLEQQNARAAKRQIRGQDALVAQIDAMSPEARQAYAGRVEKALERFGRKKR